MATLTTAPEIADALALRRRTMTLALLTTTYFFSYMDRQILAILLEDIKADLLLSDTQLGLLSGLVFAIFYATLGIPVARLADRTSRRDIIAASLAIWSAMTALCGLAQNFTQLMLARIGVGIGEAGSSPPSHSIIADLYPPDKRASAMAVYSLGVVLGAGFGTLIGGFVATHYGWRVAMFTVGLPGIALAVLVKMFVVEPRRGLSDAGRVAEQGDAPSVMAGFAAIWRSAPALHLVVGVTLTSMIGYAITGWGPSYMQRSLGLSKLDISYYIALPGALFGSISAIAGGRIADRWAKARGLHVQSWVVLVMKGLSLPLVLAFYLIDVPAIAIGCYFGSLLFANSYLGPSFALIQHLAPLRLRAMWAAITLLVINLVGLGLGPLLVGRLSDWLAPSLGEASLRWSLVAIVSLTPWALFHYWRAGVLLRRAGD
ncbi:spinster family MFS transporter [Sphingomonas rubra]|uniref:Predicted arabinose efflux permease, MFS family n=1 Tax=Sphingomonas rubra TaxID=634430 RepID=A0A1I5RRI2_9SPHN|nr:MFS transporter [Sphingomonas rubra]SFP61118.1 Predicted arabinose efflux permease, MFS family [Sphingomonas rubra]